MHVQSARPRQKSLNRRRRQWLMVLRRAGFASLLLAGNVAPHAYADTVNWMLAADGEWNVAANWTASAPPTQREPSINDDVFNTSGHTITLSGMGYANTFTTTSDFNLTGTLNLKNGLTLGTGSVFSIAGGHLVFQQSKTISDSIVTLNGGFSGSLQGTTLTLDSNTLVHGGYGGNIGTYNNTGMGGSLVNNGTISADAGGQALYAQSGYGNGSNGNQYGTFTSMGTLQAINGGYLYVSANGGTLGGSITASGSNSQVYLNGTQNLAAGATLSADNNGKIYLSGAYDNGGHAINLTAGALSMSGGTLRNSTINASGTGVGLNFATGNGTLDNVTINGALNVSGNTAFIYNNLTATGAVTVTSGGRIMFQTDSTLRASNVMVNSGYVCGQYGTTLTLADNTLIHGGNNGYVGSFYANGNYYGGSLVNNGTISADTGGRALYAQPGYDPNAGNYGVLTNNGTLQASNGVNLYVNNSGGSGTNAGTIRAHEGSSIFISNVTQTAGSTIVNGILTPNGAYTMTGGSLIGSGVVSGSVHNQGGTISAGGASNTTGTLTIANNYAQDAGSVFLVKLGGTTQGLSYDLFSVNGMATLAGQLQVQTLNNFTPFVGETFNIFTYKNRAGTFDSIFGLNGDRYSLSYNDTSGVATLHFVSPAAVPETGTLVSLGLLVVGGAFSVRRKTRQAKKTPASPPSAA